LTNKEYNSRLFELILANAEWPYKGIHVVHQEDSAKSLGLWCKALMDVYQIMARKDADCRPPESYGLPSVEIPASATPPEFKDDESGTVLDTVLYEQVASVVKLELKEFLERARDASLADMDKSLLKFLLTCVDAPVTADNDPLADF
jgi:hypothetical protein